MLLSLGMDETSPWFKRNSLLTPTWLDRALFILHREVIQSATGVARSNSYVALDTVTQMVRDIAATQHGITIGDMDMLPPSRAFVFRAALHYLDEFGTKCDRWDNVRTNLEASLTMFDQRWNAVSV
jgi:hypothetical protein